MTPTRSGSVAPPELVSELREIAVLVADEAASLLAARVGHARELVESKSTLTDMVTEMDRASERLIVARLAELRPDDALVGEEGADVAGTTGVRWVVDPLDGTTNYLYDHPGWNVSIGAEIDGVPVAGAVVIPSLAARFSAGSGAGATRNGVPLAIAEPAPIPGLLLGTGFNYDPAVRVRQAEGLSRILGAIRDIRRSGAAAADLCAVAAGQLDAFAESGLAPWDRVAGTVVATEAGARVEVLETPLPGVLTVAAHPDRFDELCDLLLVAGFLT